MSEIWNLSALCRCCHKDGHFESLQTPHMCEGNVETYSDLLRDTFGLYLKPPPHSASHSICPDCAAEVDRSACFRRQVAACERKFDEYCNNEQFFNNGADFIKMEVDVMDNDNYLSDDKSTLPLIHQSDLSLKSEDYLETKRGEIKNEDGVINEIKICIESIHNPSLSKVKRNTKIVKNKPTKLVRRIKTDPSLVESYSCNQCSATFKLKKILKRHISKMHTKTKYICEQCHEEFTSEISFSIHMTTHNVYKPFKCSYCEKAFKSSHIRSDHENSHTKRINFTCDLCKKEFVYKQSLARHMNWHKGLSKRFMCHVCGISCNDKANLTIHVRTVHDKLRPFKCAACNKSFTAKKHLTVHFRNHTGERPYQCDICMNTFISLDKMKSHRLNHGDITKRYQCIVCKIYFSDRGTFKKHVRTHIGSLPHKCHICTKDFSCKYSLKRHINEHYGFKAYSCELCDKKFTQKTQLNRHKAIHDPNRCLIKIKCDICKKNVGDMEKHKLTHINRPFLCHLCNKSYAENNTLNRHIKESHYGVKSHACDLCNKKYTKPSSLKNHKLKVHKSSFKSEIEEFDTDIVAYTIESNMTQATS